VDLRNFLVVRNSVAVHTEFHPVAKSLGTGGATAYARQHARPKLSWPHRSTGGGGAISFERPYFA
jgi:hypothetical protein